MIVTLSRRQMIDRWMLMKGFGPMRADASVVRSDGLDLEALFEAEARAWYLGMLDTAPPHLVAAEDISDRVTLTVEADSTAFIELPDDCRRVVSLRLEGWRNDALIVAPDSVEARRQDNELTRGGVWRPVAVLDVGRRLSTRSLPPGPKRIASLVAVTDGGSDVYRFDESLFPESYTNLNL